MSPNNNTLHNKLHQVIFKLFPHKCLTLKKIQLQINITEPDQEIIGLLI